MAELDFYTVFLLNLIVSYYMSVCLHDRREVYKELMEGPQYLIKPLGQEN